MINIKKLNAEDLIERAKGLKIDIEDYSNVGSIHFKLNGVYANLLVPTMIDQSKEVNMLLKFNSLNDKVAFTYGGTELREQSAALTNPYKYDRNYIFFEKENVYQVFIRNGVVAYLTEEEVTGLYAIFKEVQEILDEKGKFYNE